MELCVKYITDNGIEQLIPCYTALYSPGRHHPKGEGEPTISLGVADHPGIVSTIIMAPGSRVYVMQNGQTVGAYYA